MRSQYDTKVPLVGNASNSNETLFDDIISLVMSSAQQLVMISSHYDHLSWLHCHLVHFQNNGPFSVT